MTAADDVTLGRATREERQVVLAGLRARRERTGTLSNTDVDQAAAQLSVTARHVRRLLSEEMEPRKKAWKPKPEHWDAYYAAHGNAVKALRYLQTQGVAVKVKKRQIQRGFAEKADQALRAGAREGWSGVVSRQGYLARQIPHKCFAYSIDHTVPPVMIRPDEDHPDPYFLNETTVLDDATRLEMVVYTSDGAPDTIVTVGALGAAVEGYYADDGTFIGGKPLHVLSDNGSDLRTAPATAGLVVLGVKRQFSGVEQAWQNGRVERKHRTVQDDWCADLPGYVNPKLSLRDKEKVLAYWRAHPQELLTRGQYDVLRHGEQMRYNFERIHSELGVTPFQAWCADPYQPELADPEELRLAMLSRATRVVNKGRIRIFSDSYYSINGALSSLGGLSVEVRFLPGRYEHIEVFRHGEHLCRAYRKGDLPAEAVTALADVRAKQRTAFLAHTDAGARIRANATRQRLIESGFDAEDLPAVAEHGQTPWGAVDSEEQPKDQPQTVPVAASPAPDGDADRSTKRPTGYPTATPEELAALDDLATRYRISNGEFA